MIKNEIAINASGPSASALIVALPDAVSAASFRFNLWFSKRELLISSMSSVTSPPVFLFVVTAVICFLIYKYGDKIENRLKSVFGRKKAVKDPADGEKNGE